MVEKMGGDVPSQERIPQELETLKEEFKRELGMKLAEFNENGQYPVEGYEHIQFTPEKPENKWAWSSMEDNVQSPKFTLGEAGQLIEAGKKLAEGIRKFRRGEIEWMQLSQGEY